MGRPRRTGAAYHDVATITAHVYERVREGKEMPGVIEVGAKVPIGQAIEDILDYPALRLWLSPPRVPKTLQE